MLTFPFPEKHVSLNYNPYWYQNVCSLNIYQPWVTSDAEHRHLETVFLFFFFKVLCPRGNAVKAPHTTSQAGKLHRALGAFLHLRQIWEQEKKTPAANKPTGGIGAVARQEREVQKYLSVGIKHRRGNEQQPSRTTSPAPVIPELQAASVQFYSSFSC